MLHYPILSDQVLGACFSVHRELGPGLMESAYEGALSIEFDYREIPYIAQQVFPLYYRGRLAGNILPTWL